MAQKLAGFSVQKGMNLRVRTFEALRQVALGMGIGIVSDGAVEIARLPVLNDSGTFGNSQISNFELFFYGIGIAGIAAAIIDIGTGKGILTFSKDMIFYLVGLVIGVYFYENTLSHVLNIRKLNPYDLVGKYIPPVLPSGTNLPFVTSNPLGGSTGLGGDYLAPPSAPSIAPAPPGAPMHMANMAISIM